MRIATGTGRTGNDMRFARSAAGFLWCVGEGLCPSRGRPQGSPLRKGYKECDGRADVGIGPYGSATRGAVSGPSGTPAPTEELQEVRCGAESPSHGFAVPVPFRQGGRGDGGCGLPQQWHIYCFMCYPFWRGGGGEGSGGLCRQRAAGGKDSRGPLWAWRWPSAPARPPDPGQSPTSAG